MIQSKLIHLHQQLSKHPLCKLIRLYLHGANPVRQESTYFPYLSLSCPQESNHCLCFPES